MISVVIPYSEDQTYLIRCINSIRRQTYKDVQLILVAAQCDLRVAQEYRLQVIENSGGQPYGGINEAIRKAKGEYLYFCSITSVPAPNTLITLVKEYEADRNVWKYGSCYEEREQGYEVCQGMPISFYGKLYDLKAIRDRNIRFRENSSFAEIQFIIEYAAHMKDMTPAEKIYIYETGIQWEHPEYRDKEINPEDWKALLKEIGGLNEAVAGQILEALCSRLENYSSFFGELVDITQEYSSNWRLNYAIAKPVLQFWWEEAQTRQNQEAFNNLKAYLAGHEENEEYLELLLLACGIRKDQYLYLKKEDLWTALFLIRESSRLEEQVMSARLESVLLEMDEMRASLDTRNGLIKVGTVWHYYRNGKVDREYEGLAQNQYGWYYIKNGIIDINYNGLAANQYGTWCVERGTINHHANGYHRLGNQEVFLANGKVDVSKNGFLGSNGEWRWYREGRVDVQYSGLVKNEHGWWYVEKGEINYAFEGLAENEFGWWYIKNGTIDYSFKGYTRNNEGWHYVENGTIREDKPDLTVKADMVKAQTEEIHAQVQKELTGAELAEYAVSKYASGELGLKTIFKSLGAWVKNKL